MLAELLKQELKVKSDYKLSCLSFQSIHRAHENRAASNVYYNKGELSGDMNANINRSPYGYEANPQSERDK